MSDASGELVLVLCSGPWSTDMSHLKICRTPFLVRLTNGASFGDASLLHLLIILHINTLELVDISVE